MRLTCFFILVGTLTVSARSASQTITLSGKNMRLEQIFSSIEKQSGFFVFANKELLAGTRPVTVAAHNMPLRTFLNTVLKDQPLQFSIYGKTITFSRKPLPPDAASEFSLLPPPVVIRVVDPAGKPLSGASVSIKNSEILGITNTDGSFTIQVNAGDVIVVSYITYETRSLVVTLPMLSATNRLVITLKPAVSDLEAVEININTGYQTLPRDRSAGAFSVVSGNKLAQKSGSMNVVDRLEGLVAGLAVNYGEGNDKLLLRGVSSVNLDRQPLIILDGVPVPEYRNIESLVNPQDVKDITVLKDATAASIWGAQAANGVIVITTRSGEYNSNKINITYDGFVSLKGTPDYSSLKLMSGSEFIATAKELFQDADYLAAFPYATVSTGQFPKVYPHEQIFYDVKSGSITEAEANQQWSKLAGLSNRDQIDEYFYQPSRLSSHSITLSGGSKVNRFFGSLSYNRYNNPDKTTKDRYNFNLKEEWKLASWLMFDLNGNMSYEKGSALNMSYPIGLDQYLPYALFAGADGSPLSQSYLYMTPDYRNAAEEKSQSNLDYVPLNELNYNRNSNSVIAARVNAGFKIDLYKGLSFRTRGQFQKNIDDGYDYYDQNAYRVRLENAQFTQAPATPGGDPVHFLPVKGGHYYTNHLNVTSQTIRNQLDYSLRIANDHQITALAGHEVRSTLFDVTNTLTRGYDFQTQLYEAYNQKDLELTGVSNAVLPDGTATTNTLRSMPIRKAETSLRFVSVYGNLAYAYKSKYNFNGSLRFDQSNLFGTSKSSQNKPIWSTGLSWNIDREDFFNPSLFSRLTLRATYGISGNSPAPGLGGTNDVLFANSNAFYNGMGTGYIIITPGNNQLVWEKSTTFNLGVDFELLARRISGSIDYYNKQTSFLLGERPLDPTTGWYSAYGNLGELYNKGLEISLNSRNIVRKDFNWSTHINISFNKNKIISLKRYATLGVDAKVSGGFIEGYSAYSLFAYRYAGLNSEGNPTVYKQDGSTGMFTNQLTLNDTYYQGSTQPLWYGGITNLFTYKQFTLSGLIVYNLGNVMRGNANQFYTDRLSENIQSNFNDRWKNHGDEATTNVPKYIPNKTASASQRTTSFYTKSDVNIVSASYIKLRDLTLSYNLPVSKRYMQQAKAYVQMNNALLWTKNKEGIDPEYYNLITGTSFKAMPAFYTIGLNLSF